MLFLMLLLCVPLVAPVGMHALSKTNKKDNGEFYWVVYVKTCDVEDASITNDAVMILYDEFGKEHIFKLENTEEDGRKKFVQGAQDYFLISSKSKDYRKMSLHYESSRNTFADPRWCVLWVTLIDWQQQLCYRAIFKRWITRDPLHPTFADSLTYHSLAECIRPPFVSEDEFWNGTVKT